MQKILLTGASGFVGGYLLDKIQNKYKVHCLENNLLDYAEVKKEVLDFNPEIIVHLAARTEVEKSFYEQTTFSEINYVGSVNLIESAALLPNLKNFLFASTMEVYGWQPISDVIQQGNVPEVFEAFDENTVPNPNAPYAVAKLAVEKYLQYMKRSHDFPFCIVRQTNSYGRKDNDFFVTEQIISQMLRNPEQIRLGYKNPWRNFIFIDDLIDVWESLIAHTETVCDGAVFTIGPNQPIKISDWANLIASRLDWHGQILWDTKPKRPGEIYWLNSDSALIHQTIGWKPKIDYISGIDQTIKIWKKKLADASFLEHDL